MSEIIIYDTEYWTEKNAPQRIWSGLDDHPPHLVQISAVKLKLQSGLPIIDEYNCLIIPRGAQGQRIDLTPFFTKLTKITTADLDQNGIELKQAINEWSLFCGKNNMYSYGPDMLRTVIVSCFIQGLTCPFNANQALDIRQIYRKAGISDDILNNNSSGTIAKALGLNMKDVPFDVHDARYDTYSLVRTLQHLEKSGKIKPSCL